LDVLVFTGLASLYYTCNELFFKALIRAAFQSQGRRAEATSDGSAIRPCLAFVFRENCHAFALASRDLHPGRQGEKTMEQRT
jgi:hypothetical protein